MMSTLETEALCLVDHMADYIRDCGCTWPVLQVKTQEDGNVVLEGLSRPYAAPAVAGPLLMAGASRVRSLRRQRKHKLLMRVARIITDVSITILVDMNAEVVVAKANQFSGETMERTLSSSPNFTLPEEVEYARTWSADEWNKWHSQLRADMAAVLTDAVAVARQRKSAA